MTNLLNIFGLSSFGNLLGAVGSFLLLLPPAADQVRRLRMKKWRSSATNAPQPLRDVARTAVGTLEANQSRWRAWESLSMALGGGILMLSFWN